MSETQFIDRPGAEKLAYRLIKPVNGKAGPTIVFLPGYMSDMTGGKATALADWAVANGRGCLLFDYAGCGESGGDFAEQGLADWRDDALFLIDRLTQGPITLVGSSMGGWLLFLIALARPMRVKNLVGIAPAPDFTNWGFTQEQKLTILREGRLEEASEYSGEPYVTTAKFYQSAESLRILHGDIAFDGPVRLLHGQRDEDVPWTYTPEIAKKLRSDDVHIHLVKDGDHRLSRDSDIALLVDTVARLA